MREDTINYQNNQNSAMKVVVAIDSFKGSLTSLEAGEAIRQGIHRVIPDAEVFVRPLADGGEGTVEALTLGMGGTLHTIEVTGPLGTPVQATYGIAPLPNKKESSEHGQNLSPCGGNKKGVVAIIEMSAAAGITLVPPEERNPLHTTTYGVGELIRDAINKGCRHFIVGIGGSATNDGGIGMLQALGFDLLDKDGNQVPFGAKGLQHLTTISTEHVLPELQECTFKVACDVTNPLCGPQGCSAIFGPQKGATPEMTTQMDSWLQHYAELAHSYFSMKKDNLEHGQVSPLHGGTEGGLGAGAAGGLGFAFLTFLPAVLESGIQIVLEETHLEDYIRNADLVITGEGRLDKQTVMGKAPIGVARIAKKHNKRVLAFAGCITPEAGVCNEHGIDAFFPILRTIVTLEEAMKTENAKKNMTDTVEQVFRLLN